MIKRAFERLSHTRAFHRGHMLIHTGYFSLVAVEGHGLYASAGGLMAVLTVIVMVGGGSDA